MSLDKKLAIIDHVGLKAGMDLYDIGLATNLSSVLSKVIIYSNFDSKKVEVLNFFLKEKSRNVLYNYYRLVKDLIFSLVDIKKKDINNVIIHSFANTLVDFIFVLSSKILGLNVIVIAHDIEGFGETKLRYIKMLVFNRLVNKIVVHNTYSYNAITKLLNVNPKKIKIIKHGGFTDLEVNTVDQKQAKSILNLQEHDRHVLFFGQIKDEKGLDILISAIPLVNANIKLVIAGKPFNASTDKYLNLIKNLKIEDRIINHFRYIQNDEKGLFFAASDCIVIPYKKIYQSGVLLSAMSFNIPVIVSNLEANIEIVHDNINGLVFESENHVDLAEKINYYFNNMWIKEKMVHNAYTFIKNEYAWDVVAQEYLTLLR